MLTVAIWRPDPYTTARKDYTAAICSKDIPENANATYKKLVEGGRKLVNCLLNDPAMAPNREQTFMTPAASKNRVYFMWDYVQRTLCYLNELDAIQPSRSSGVGEGWADCQGRITFAISLILDADRKLAAMMPGDTTPFSEEVLAATKELDKLSS
jgi:hypothetical protein